MSNLNLSKIFKEVCDLANSEIEVQAGIVVAKISLIDEHH